MKKLRISTTLNMHPTVATEPFGAVSEGVKFAKSVGFDALDFPICTQSLFNGSVSPERYAEHVLRVTEEEGIRFELSHLPYSTAIVTDKSLLPAFEEKMYRAIDFASLLGVGYAVLHPNTVTLSRAEYDRRAQHDAVISHIAPFVEYAERRGVNIVVENMRLVPGRYPCHRYCQEPDELCEVADALGVGVCWDFGHANISGFIQSEALKYIGSRLKVLHVNDNKGIDDEHLPPFFGTVDWVDAMHGLHEAGFDGLFNYELAVAAIPSAVRPSFARCMVDAAHELITYVK